MGRSWPLQEGAVAQNLFLKLQDESIILSDNLYRSIGLPSLRMLQYNTHKYSAYPHIYDTRFTDVWNGLVKRSTKEPEDLAGIFATLVNLRAGEILKHPKEDRMMAILRAQTRLPLTLLFQPNDVRHKFWVPQFPDPESGADILLNLYGDLVVTDEGLLVNRFYNTIALLRRGDLPEEGNFKLQIDDKMFWIMPYGPILKYNPADDPSRTPLEPPLTLLLLGTACFGSYMGKQGARFSVISRNESSIRLHFEAAFSWVRFGDVAESTGLSCENFVEIHDVSYVFLIVMSEYIIISTRLTSWKE